MLFMINIDWTILINLANSFGNAIKNWANSVVDKILGRIDKAIEVASDAIVYLIKENNRYYKEVKVYMMNIGSREVRFEIQKEVIQLSEIPEDIRKQLEERCELKLMQMKTA
jgi:hypothetical protein